MRFALLHKISLFTLAAIGVLPLILSGELGTYLGPTFTACVLLGWFLPEHLMKKTLYRNIATAVLASIFVVQCTRIFNGEHLAIATIEFSVLILSVKLCMRSEYGDYQQIVLMSFIALIASTVTSYNVSYALFFIIFVFLSPVTMFLTQMRKEMEIRFTRADDSMRQRLLNSSRIVTGKNIGVPVAGSILLLMLIAVVFAVIPRWGIGAGGGILPGKKMFGFTNEVKIGDLSQTMEKQDVFLRLWPKPPSQRPPDKINTKFRGQVFDTWRDGIWHSGPEARFRYIYSARGVYALQTVPIDSRSEFTIMQASTEPPFLFVPPRSHSIHMNGTQRRGYVHYPRLLFNANGVLKYQDRRKVGIRYNVIIGDQPFAAIGDPHPDRNLQLPKNSGPIEELARQWTRGAETPKDQIKRILSHFQRDFGYTKTISEKERNASTEGPILNRFLFSYRKGTCEHFATAGVLMFRSLGIPARFVTGFQGAQWNSVGEYYTVNASNAHAWTEVYVNNRWHTVDPTPQRSGAEAGDDAPKNLYLKQLMDTIAMRWHEYIIDYSETTQVNLIRTILPRTTGNGSLFGFSLSQRHLALAALLALSIFAILKRKQLKKIFHILRQKKAATLPQSTTLFLRLEAKLSLMIGPRKPHQTPKQYVTLAAEKSPNAAPLLTDFLEAYHLDRFGGKPMSPAVYRELQEQISRLSNSNHNTL